MPATAVLDALKDLLAANPRVEIRDSAGIVVARRVDAAVRRRAIQDCLEVAERAAKTLVLITL